MSIHVRVPVGLAMKEAGTAPEILATARNIGLIDQHLRTVVSPWPVYL
jgi:hypothetical protein